MQQQVFTLMGIEQWVQAASAPAVKYCGIHYHQHRGLLAVSPDDIHATTRVVLQKMLQALQLKTTKHYEIDGPHDCLLIIGLPLAQALTGVDRTLEEWHDGVTMGLGEKTSILVIPALTIIHADIAIKKQVWKYLSAYFLQST